ncbi:hypothetical protein DICSQDRAFT_137339 [Dichomitus squalens LYAD-421 SS1]|uniref:Uncharacterized protein n=1 Tax=Dichomitus squalens (strain LYAD-421) TaxID=732165 RepID=R7SWC5_DICSQ|nr:uncharacterized protein DICSQDRAFT_137339 [Dichomitus squalens LYAD-421 SS1]EJF60494.1 hypothetical protein DICSQDRAFT_137339 [Dichomitus squalens LYAD-421 SS1]
MSAHVCRSPSTWRKPRGIPMEAKRNARPEPRGHQVSALLPLAHPHINICTVLHIHPLPDLHGDGHVGRVLRRLAASGVLSAMIVP